MGESLHEKLSRRESQVMNVVYEHGEVTVEQIRESMPDPPSNSSVRSTLRILEQKGHLTHRQEGRRYIYRPTTSQKQARRSAIRDLVNTFFGGSVPRAVASILSMSTSELSEDELDRLSQLIDQSQEVDDE